MTNSSIKSLKLIAKEILQQGYLMSLATIDESGPWVSDVIYVFDDAFSLYWISKTNTRHSKALGRSPQVAATITVSNQQGEKNIGLQIEGLAEVLIGDNILRATKHRLKRGKPAPQILGEVLDKDEAWYSLRPSKIEIIYESYWGYNKKIIEKFDLEEK